MDTTSWLVTVAGLAAMAWVVWFFWLSETPRADDSAVHSNDNPNEDNPQTAMPAKKEVIDVEGMSCGHCVKAVEEALAELDGVEEYEVAIGSVEVAYDPDRTSRGTIEAAIEQAGYEVASPA